MIKLVGQANDGTPLLILGLTAENVKRLQDGQPVLINHGALGLPAQMTSIVYGQDEDSITRQLEEAGAIPPGIADQVAQRDPDEEFHADFRQLFGVEPAEDGGPLS